jgi:hypothetical protein
MTVEILNQLFKWTVAVLPFVLAFAGVGALITGNIIGQRKDAEIQSLKSRGLRPEQAVKMAAVARQLCQQIKKVPVTAANGNQEAQAYALDFVKLFKDAGCDADLELPIPGLTPDVQGIRIGVRTLNNIPAEVGLIEQILHVGEINYEVNPLKPDFFPNEPFMFIVGAKLQLGQ